MSKITSIYNTLLALPDLLFTGGNVKTRLIFPYNVDHNPEHLLRNGWTLQDLGQTPVDSELKTQAEATLYQYVLTREVVKTDDQVASVDAQYLKLKEDIQIIRNRLVEPDELGIESTISIIRLQPVSGVEFTIGDQINFMELGTSFSVELRESISI